MVHARMMQYTGSDGYWTDASIAFMNSGGKSWVYIHQHVHNYFTLHTNGTVSFFLNILSDFKRPPQLKKKVFLRFRDQIERQRWKHYSLRSTDSVTFRISTWNSTTNRKGHFNNIGKYSSEVQFSLLSELNKKKIHPRIFISVNYVRYSYTIGRGEFFQYSGMYVSFNLTQPSGSRVQSVQVRCAKCDVPRFYDLQENQTYNVIVTSFLTEGGDGHSTFLVSVNL